MAIFLEKFVLSLFAGVVLLLALTNPMRFDWTQRITGAVGLLFLAYFAAHTVQVLNQKKETASQDHPAQRSSVSDARPQAVTGASQRVDANKSALIVQKSLGANSPNIVGNGNIVGSTVIIHAESSKHEPRSASASTLSAEESIRVGATAGAGDYIQKFGGIEWKPEYSELQIALSNPTSSDFLNLDFTILPDLMIAGTGEATSFNAQFIANGSNVPLPPDINEQLAEKR